MIGRALANLQTSPLRGELLLRIAINRANSGPSPIDMLQEALDAGGLDQTSRLEMSALLAVCFSRAARHDEARATAQDVAQELARIDDDAANARLLLRLGSVHFPE